MTTPFLHSRSVDSSPTRLSNRRPGGRSTGLSKGRSHWRPTLWSNGWATLVLALSAAGEASAQRFFRPSSVWGDVSQEPRGLILGNAEILTFLLMALLVAWVGSLWLLREARSWKRLSHTVVDSEARRLASLVRRRRKLAAWLTYGVFPALGVPTILVAAQRTLFGIDVASIAMLLALAGVTTALAAFLVATSAQARLGRRSD